MYVPLHKFTAFFNKPRELNENIDTDLTFLSRMLVTYMGFSLDVFFLCNLSILNVVESRESLRNASNKENESMVNYSNRMTPSNVTCIGVACMITVSEKSLSYYLT